MIELHMLLRTNTERWFANFQRNIINTEEKKFFVSCLLMTYGIVQKCRERTSYMFPYPFFHA